MKSVQCFRVGVLLGGPSNERSVSLLSGENVIRHLQSHWYDVTAIDIQSEYVWVIRELAGTEVILDVRTPWAKKKLKEYNVFFNVLHGSYGEDGRLQRFLDDLGVPYTGSGTMASRLAMNKARAQRIVTQAGLKVPAFFMIRTLVSLQSIDQKIKTVCGYPVIVKPNTSGSTIGLSLVRTKRQLALAIKKAAHESSQVMVQQYIPGREFTCGVYGKTIGRIVQSLPSVEIIAPGSVFGFHAKYRSRVTREVCPSKIDLRLERYLRRQACIAHRTLGCLGLTRSDFRLSPDGELYYLETNTSPGMTNASLCPKEIVAAGMDLSHFLDRMIRDTLLSRRKKYVSTRRK